MRAAGYSSRANRKTREGPPHPDRDAQFRHITAQVCQFQAAGQPVISVDTKKKELVGDFKGRPMFAVEFAGRRYDPGDKLGFLKATVEFALARPDLADEFRNYLASLDLRA